MGTATLGFKDGPAVAFRIDPELISWNWQILTNVIETIGGRVIQVIGAYLEDLTVQGSFGQDHSTPFGVSWRQAEAFLKLITQIMEFQSRDSNQQNLMHQPAIFTYPPKGWRFQVYVKDFSDAEGGGSVVLTPGKFNNRYQLTLFIVQEASEALVQAGTTNGVLNQKSNDAIAAYFARISDGIGWHFSQYNGPIGAINQTWIKNWEASQQPTSSPVPTTPNPKPGGGGGGGPGGGGSGGGTGGSAGPAWVIQLSVNSYVPPAIEVSSLNVVFGAIAGPFRTKDAAGSWLSAHGGSSWVAQRSDNSTYVIQAGSLAKASQIAELTNSFIAFGPYLDSIAQDINDGNFPVKPS